eukprot:m.834600 g.834600  ORF g.834600 m.834600 type:complete len:121 (-) comp23448_c0_seq18:368-730(-)
MSPAAMLRSCIQMRAACARLPMCGVRVWMPAAVGSQPLSVAQSAGQQNYEDANVTKVKLEEKQRSRRREMERTKQTWVPRWFQRGQDPCIPSRSIHQYKGGYWEAKMQGEWDNVIDLYTT